MAKQKIVILGITGSIAAYKAGDIIRRLKDQGFRVVPVMTKGALQFITPLTLSSLSEEKVYSDMFSGRVDSWEIEHIDLARQADILLIAPATANIIGKIANGIADDLLTAVSMATKAPILIAPAMNTHMYENKILQENCTKLKKYGVSFVDPIKGKLACGDIGKGHLASVDNIVKKVIQIVK
ncbi:MAG: hypothetical protein KKD07_06995 [Candidatus Omnitrophica bacterium]|nr:hypothetical protein [Candidatus Omnitrophota bacterium]MBU1997650.1 hypothetical protein [Candidatus Omnitrophota bacterium]MBU4334171.1 hypothetical protein [Candidatus Omnitrophota bacterium]